MSENDIDATNDSKTTRKSTRTHAKQTPVIEIQASKKRSSKAPVNKDADEDRMDVDEDEDEDEEEQDEEADKEVDELEDADDESDFEAPAASKSKANPKAKSAVKSAGKGKGKGKVGAPVAATASNGKAKAKRAPRKKKVDVDAEEEEGEGDAPPPPAQAGGHKGDMVIEEDNNLFNAVRNSNSALESVVEDWIESYENDEGVAMAELINFVLRVCGCNSSVDEHQAQDEDGIVDILDTIQDEFKNSTLLAYPLLSRTKSFKKFRTSLSTFLTLLYTTTSSSHLLYTSTFSSLLQSWLSSLSSSKIRSFRHTATVIALMIVKSLSQVSVIVNKEFEGSSRAKEAEEKKKRKDKERLKDLGKRVEEVHERKVWLEDALRECFEGVFVHRYRDSEQIIRSECVRSLGEWMKVYPDYYLEGDYLRYIGWVLSDDHKEVRHDALKALLAVYSSDSHIGQLQHFTHRFKSQLVKMATSEIELPVKICAIEVLRKIDQHGLLEEEQRDEIGKLIFESEKKVRVAVGPFFVGLVEERTEEREKEIDAERVGRGGEREEEVDEEEEERRKKWLGWKTLVGLLCRYGRELDGLSSIEGEDDLDTQAEDNVDKEGEGGDESLETREQENLLRDVIGGEPHKGRIALAIESLWSVMDSVRDWQGIVEFLLLDHSSAGREEEEEGDGLEDNNATPRAKKGKGKGRRKNAREGLKKEYRLMEEEETLLIEVLVAALTQATKTSGLATKKEKEEEEETSAAISRVMMDALPRLFAKSQTFKSRMIDILAIPRIIDLRQYLDLRRVTTYESLWDDVTKQFLTQTDLSILSQSIKTISHFLSINVLSTTNETKISSLEQILIDDLNESVQGKDVQSDPFEEDEVKKLEGVLRRIDKLGAGRDLSEILEESREEGRESAYEVLDAWTERARLGYKNEEVAVQHGLNILSTHLCWQLTKAANIAKEHDAPISEGELATLIQRRTALLEKVEEFSIGVNSNAAEIVKQSSLVILLDIYTFLAGLASEPNGRLAKLSWPMTEQLQARLSGFVEAEIERYGGVVQAAKEKAEKKKKDAEEVEEVVEEEGEDDDEEDDAEKKKKKNKKLAKEKEKEKKGKSKVAKKVEKLTPAQVRAQKAEKLAALVAAMHFERTIGPYVRALHIGIIEIRHSPIVLVHYERFSVTYDTWVRLLVQDLRDEGMYGDSGRSVARILNETLQSAFDLYLDAGISTEEQFLSLSRQLINAVVVRGAQLAIVKRLPRDDHIFLHTESLNFIISRLALLEQSKRKEMRNSAICYFKAIANWLIGTDGKQALAIKNRLDELIEAKKIEIPATSKVWEPLRAYQKRLLTAMSKDPSIKTAAKEKVKKAAVAKSDAGDGSDADADEGNKDDEDDAPAPAPKPARPKARRSAAAQKAAENDSDDDEVLPPRKTARSDKKREAPTDPTKSKSSAVKKRKLAPDSVDGEEEQEEEAEEEREEEEEEVLSQLLPSSPQKSKKRPNPVDEEDEQEGEAGEDEAEDEAAAESNGIARPPNSARSVGSISDLRKQKRAKR